MAWSCPQLIKDWWPLLYTFFIVHRVLTWSCFMFYAIAIFLKTCSFVACTAFCAKKFRSKDCFSVSPKNDCPSVTANTWPICFQRHLPISGDTFYPWLGFTAHRRLVPKVSDVMMTSRYKLSTDVTPDWNETFPMHFYHPTSSQSTFLRATLPQVRKQQLQMTHQFMIEKKIINCICDTFVFCFY